MLRRASGEVESVGRWGTLLGVLPTLQTHDVEVSLGPGDTLVLVTDGVLEARDGHEQWKEAGLCALLQSETDVRPAPLARAVVTAATRFQKGATSDDIAVVVVAPGTGVEHRTGGHE
jgi:serine phosphatase RsbU (regulator of sigma subunit)